MQVSFKANLKQNNFNSSKLPKSFNKDELLTLYNDYEKFLKEDKIINSILPESEISLSAISERGGYVLNMDIFEKNQIEPFNIPISVSKGKKPHFELSSLKFQTYLYAAYKTGIKPRLLESSKKFIKRAMTEYFSQK